MIIVLMINKNNFKILYLAEKAGFEPAKRFHTVYTLSRRASSATRASLLKKTAQVSKNLRLQSLLFSIFLNFQTNCIFLRLFFDKIGLKTI